MKMYMLVLFGALSLGCSKSDDQIPLDIWTIPRTQVLDGGPGKDGIPALENPPMISAVQATYLEDDDLVVGYKLGEDVRAYPHPILDWHEIINDEVNAHPVAITYCPLTGTAIGWERTLNGQVTTFGVSGLLYNSNLIPYDRLTNSNWSQMRVDCVNGDLIGEEVETFPLVETTWKTWKALYPQTKVVSTETGINRNYQQYPYGDYRTNNRNIIFPVQPRDKRIGEKERVHGIIVGEVVKAFQFSHFERDIDLIEDEIGGVAVVLVGSQLHNFIVSFERILPDGTTLIFKTTQDKAVNGDVVLIDNEGSTWNIMGEAIDGPRAGQKLVATKSFMGYWFSWGAFYPDLQIYSRN